MNQQDLDIARAARSQKLVTYYFIDVAILARAMQAALPASAGSLAAETISTTLTADLSLFPERAGGWYRVADGQEFIGAHLFVRRYSRWMKSLGAALVFSVETMNMEDDWVTDDMPALQAIVWGLMDRARHDLKAARAITDPLAVGLAFQVVRQSVRNGEHPHQTQVRASRITQGLRLVHGDL